MKKKSTGSPHEEQDNELIVGAGNDILVVDDDKVVLDFIKMHLSDEGYNIVLAENGIKAIKCLKERFFNLMLVDKNLPDINGLALIKMCREINSDTEAVMITAHASLESAVEAIGLGAYDYILKPFDPTVLREKVKRAMDHQKVKYENRVLMEFLKKANLELESSKKTLEELVQTRTEELKRANEDLKKLGKIKEDILSTVLQEIQALRKRMLSYHMQEAPKLPELLEGECVKLSQLISDISELSKLEVVEMS